LLLLIKKIPEDPVKSSKKHLLSMHFPCREPGNAFQHHLISTSHANDGRNLYSAETPEGIMLLFN
jgi:hypothetical protein